MIIFSRLTAFVVKSFHQAKSFIFIDDDTIKRAVDWMITRQNSDGSFPEPGRVIHKDMQVSDSHIYQSLSGHMQTCRHLTHRFTSFIGTHGGMQVFVSDIYQS